MCSRTNFRLFSYVVEAVFISQASLNIFTSTENFCKAFPIRRIVTGFSESLGERLEANVDPELLLPAMICYVCAGSLDKFVACWLKTRPQTNKPSDLQVCHSFFFISVGLSALGIL